MTGKLEFLDHDTDDQIAVVGAGPAGSVAAYVLARAGCRVLLIDSDINRQDDRPSGAIRIGETLPGAARPVMRDLGLLNILDNASHRPCPGNAFAWGTSTLETVDAIRDPNGSALRLDRAVFDRDLRRAARDAGAYYLSHRVMLPPPESSGRAGWAIKGPRGCGIHVSRILDTSGRKASVARGMGAIRVRDIGLIALYRRTIAAKQPEQYRFGAAVMLPCPGESDARVLVEAVPDGWWYTALLPDGSRITALHVDIEDAAKILRTEGEWEARLLATEHIGRFALEVPLSAPAATEACGARLDRFSGPGWIAAGDAALSFDPLSSQGIFNALYTGMRAAQTIIADLGGDPAAYSRYSERMEAIRAAYLEHWSRAYMAEQRWPTNRFWARRQRTPNHCAGHNS